MRIDGIGGGQAPQLGALNGTATNGNQPQRAAGAAVAWPGTPDFGGDMFRPEGLLPDVGGLGGAGQGMGHLMDLMEMLIQLLAGLLQQQGAGQAGGGTETQPNGGAGAAAGAAGVEKGDAVDGPEGFLFKPTSESDGNLVVLLPKEMSGDVESVVLKDQSGNVIDEGRFAAVANGGREHFRFNEAGGDYPENITVEVQMKDGSVKSYDIADPSKRYD